MKEASFLRGSLPPCDYNARAIAALTSNPGCDRRTILDIAAVDKRLIANHMGFPSRFGQSQFAIIRGKTFEKTLKADTCTVLARVLDQCLAPHRPPLSPDTLSPDTLHPDTLHPDTLSYENLGAQCAGSAREDRHDRTREALLRAVKEAPSADIHDTSTKILLDHPLLTLDVAGVRVYLEPDLITFPYQGQFRIVEIKSFAVIDGQADATAVAAAATQAAIYVLALRSTLDELGVDPDRVCHDMVLVCPRDFSNQPIATLIDIRKQISVVRRQLARMTRAETLLASLPPEMTFDLQLDSRGIPTRSPDDMMKAVESIPARYVPECLSVCELALFCRDRAHGTCAALGRDVREHLGGIDDLTTVLALARGNYPPPPEHVETVTLLKTAYQLRVEAQAMAAT